MEIKTKFYYAVAEGRNPGIYLTWDEAEKEVKGYSGARYKKFSLLDDAISFIKDIRVNHFSEEDIEIKYSKINEKIEKSNEEIDKVDDINNLNEQKDIIKSLNWTDKQIETQLNSRENKNLLAYTDGSYINSDTHSSWGFIILPNRLYGVDKFINGYGKVDSYKFSKQFRNVYGEISAVVNLLQYLDKVFNKEYNVLIHHDYTGISEWANNRWKANNKLTQLYKKEVNDRRATGKIKIEFKKVLAHSNNEMNEMADRLADKGHKLPPSRKEIYFS